ncbi:S8 family serine peptidase [Streptomyces aureus]|uniref:S8 family serine peptidase n=1 Tax=Streptomyces aureus TaxID=193461 RepID=UPI001ADFAFC1|nr:S8 family serine peptidase [Streptomyces aureus]
MDCEKLAPLLRLAYEEYRQNDTQALKRRARMFGIYQFDEESPGKSLIGISVECSRGVQLRDLGVKFGLNAGVVSDRFAVGVVPIKAIPDIADCGAVKYVASSPPLRSKMDAVGAAIGLDVLRRNRGDGTEKLDGDGIIIGVVDSGIDPRHPDFYDRIDRIWDQTISGPGVPGASYGTELTGHHVQRSVDADGHGTHVAGIAAGHSGVAPASRLVIVKLAAPKVGNGVIDAVNYIFGYADQMKLPAVVNISLGTHYGPHDGTGHFSQILNGLVGDGRIICCAAGNEGKYDIHARLAVADGQVVTVPLNTVEGDTSVGGWYSDKDSIGVSVVSPSGDKTAIEDGRNSVGRYTFRDGVVEIARGNGPGRDRNFEVLLRNAASSGDWRINLHAQNIRNGRVDLWVQDDRGSVFSGPYADSRMTVCHPADTDRVVAVAAYTSKVRWRSAVGPRSVPQSRLDDIWERSSLGPRRDGGHKPDVAAPGVAVVSARSGNAPVPDNRVIDSEYCVWWGTSMATPVVTGTVALLLQMNKGLAPEQAVSKLGSLSSIPGRASGNGTWDPQWGHGLVNISTI